VSSECARHAVASGADEARVVVEPNAVDPDLFRPRTDERLRDELVPKGSLVVGFHGRLRPWHNFALLVEALELLLAEGLPIHLLVLGEGPIRDELGRGPLAKHATIVGWKPHAEAAATVACMDVVPLTYSPDNPFWYSPLKLLEAMAVGAVPIVPRMGDLPNVVMHGVEGLVYAPGDVSALVGAIRSLASDDAWRVFLSRGARRRAERRSWNAIAADVLTLARERRPA
jgi:glycosyltransferase involved in cell wall biosynthesis